MTLHADDEVMPPLLGRILVTGGGGNIGKHLIRRLVSSGIPVTSIDLLFYEGELQQIHRDLPESKELLRVIQGDIRDETALESAFTHDIIGVVNLAAVSRVLWCLENEDDCEDVNVRAVDLVLEAMKRNGGQSWIIQASSREIYGSQDVLPVKEDAPVTPANVYGTSKARAEKVIERHVSERNAKRGATRLHAIALRLSNVYGGENDHRERLVPSIVTQAMAHRPIQIVGGSQNLDMVHIDDVIDAFIVAIGRLEARKQQTATGHWPFNKQPPSQFEAFNVASGVSTSVDELLGKVLEITQSASPLQTILGDDRFPDRFLGDTTRSSNVLNFTARISIDEGIHRLAMAYLRQTVDYLERKIDDSCTSKHYTVKDLLKLDGCSGSIATGGSGHTEYLYSDGEQFGWRDDLEPQSWAFEVNGMSDEDAVFRFSSDAGYLKILEDGQATGEGESRFRLRLDPTSGHVAMLGASTGRPILGSEQLFRLTPFCCANQESPWPFFREDPLASAIFDLRGEQSHDLSGSRPQTRCTRLASARETAVKRLNHVVSFARPIKLEQAALPTGSPAEWRVRHLPACTNICDHPTICLDTGSCMCVQSSCPTLSRFPFASSANLPILSYPTPIRDDSQSLHPDVLKDQLKRSNWLNVLRPHTARYLGRSPPFMQVNLTRLPDEAQYDRDSNTESYDKLHNIWYGCYSADSALERGVKQISTDYSEDGLVFLPYYQVTKMYEGDTLDKWFDNARQHNLPRSFDEASLVIPFAHDWGPCNFWHRTLFEARTHAWATRAAQKGTAWSPMGDLNVDCYRPDQDVVVPSRTCLQDDLREHFGNIGQVRPVRQRTNLATFKGEEKGQGSTIRRRITCPRPYQKFTESKLEGGAFMPSYWNVYPEGKDYLQTLGDTVFCPLPPGITGWATRTIDVIYSGCIPVLIGDQTHHPFWDMLDWSKFSVQISEGELDRLEEILLGYSWSQTQQLQTNLMLVRDAFLYPSEENMEQHFLERGPFFFAMHGTALLRQTKFPI